MLFTCHLLAINTDTRALTRDLPALYSLPAIHPHVTRRSPALYARFTCTFPQFTCSLPQFTYIFNALYPHLAHFNS